MTRFFKARIKSFYDIHTSKDTLQVIRIGCGGADLQRRTLPYWSIFKSYKLGKLKISMSPASTLPVDPTGLSYEDGEQFVDPRDQFNKGLVRITNGEDFWNLDTVTKWAQNQEQADAVYNTMLMDNRWFKFDMQSGMTRTARPLYWSVGIPHQNSVPGACSDFIQTVEQTSQVFEDSKQYAWYGPVHAVGQVVNGSSAPRWGSWIDADMGLHQTGHKERIGWLPTQVNLHDEFKFLDSAPDNPVGRLADCLSQDVITIVLPKAHKTQYYFRVYVTEEITFRDPIAINVASSVPGQGLFVNGLDTFVSPAVNSQWSPVTEHSGYVDRVNNDGSDGDEINAD